MKWMAWTRHWASSLLVAGLLWCPAHGAWAVEPPALAHAESYRAGIDPAPYWVSEKLDGVRAVWDGAQMRFRSGNPIHAPVWFTRGLPAQKLDGELWIGRGQFDRLSGIVRKAEPDDAEWREVKYMLFELPDAPGTFSERVAAMARLVHRVGMPHLRMVEQFRVRDGAELQRRRDEVVSAGGEGLMLHRADALYQAGRSEDMLKFKPWDDAEAVVISHLPGQGKYQGKLGSLLVQLPDGRHLRLGSGFSDAQRADPPPVGATVTYRYRGFSATGLPRFATFLRVREAF
jgi:DNA ligase-1